MLATVGTNLGEAVSDLYAENILAKIYRTATKSLVGEHRFPDYFPEYVPQDGGHAGSYVLREAEFWTCGFFPGSLHSLWERAIRFPRSIRIPGGAASREDDICIEDIRLQLQGLCNIWSRPLHAMASRTDTHDIGFIVMPALKLDWELTGNQHSLNSIIRAARSLATRYVPTAGAIRSWDLLLKKNLEITDQTENMILIIDSMCNLDLLYYAAEHCRDGQELYDIATSHATVLLRSHLREEKPQPLSQDCYAGPWYSTCHVANIDPRTGDLKARLTHQGYANESTWARGQAWGIMGYAQTYMSTKTETFLQAACGLAEYFIYRLETAPDFVNEGGRYVPLWDFDAPIEDRSSPLRDSSAGSIAANGMLILSQALAAAGETKLSARYLRMAVKLVRELLEFAQAPEKARLVTGSSYAIQVEDTTPTGFDGILKFGTANNNQYSKKRYANHGLVYGDYYLVEFGNRLLRMGLV
ncbi:Six-hairpin glycosidase [Thozetella sp. PMI_491]|nr:Six-hairpin glycosidase [Thozetella sp. PMI_491]